jgi:hypothetical protein
MNKHLTDHRRFKNKSKYAWFPVKVIENDSIGDAGRTFRWIWLDSYITFKFLTEIGFESPSKPPTQFHWVHYKRFKLDDSLVKSYNYYEIVHFKQGDSEWFEVHETYEDFYKDIPLYKNTFPTNYIWNEDRLQFLSFGYQNDYAIKYLSTRKAAEKIIEELIKKKEMKNIPPIVQINRTRYP